MSLQFGIHTPGQVCTLQMSSASFCCYIDAYVSDISDEISEALLHCYLNYATSRSRHASRHTRDLKSGAKYHYSTSVIFLSLGSIFWPISSEATGLDTGILLTQHAPKSNKTQIMKVRQVQQGLSNRLLSLSLLMLYLPSP
jgi:hypothetical protein